MFKPIILTGNAGVGKTYLAYTISDILGLPLYKINAPGASTGRGIVGDSRTYNSSAPGEIVQSIVKNQTSSLVILVDEIDKATSQSRANTHNLADELLSALDSTRQIHDLFQEADISTANMCFILTCNDLSLINPYLKDRCMIINFPDPDRTRSYNILNNYINKKLNNEIYSNRIIFPESILNELVDTLYIKHQTSLRQYIASVDKIVDDAFFRLLSNRLEKYIITDEDITKLEKSLPSTHKKYGFEL